LFLKFAQALSQVPCGVCFIADSGCGSRWRRDWRGGRRWRGALRANAAFDRILTATAKDLVHDLLRLESKLRHSRLDNLTENVEHRLLSKQRIEQRLLG